MIVKRPEEGSLGSRLNSVQGREKGRRTQVIGSAAGLLGSLILFWSGDAAAVYALTTLGILGAVISFILLVTYGTRWYQDKQNADILRSAWTGRNTRSVFWLFCRTPIPLSPMHMFATAASRARWTWWSWDRTVFLLWRQKITAGG